MMMSSRENEKDIQHGCTSAVQNNQLDAKCITKKQAFLDNSRKMVKGIEKLWKFMHRKMQP